MEKSWNFVFEFLWEPCVIHKWVRTKTNITIELITIKVMIMYDIGYQGLACKLRLLYLTVSQEQPLLLEINVINELRILVFLFLVSLYSFC